MCTIHRWKRHRLAQKRNRQNRFKIHWISPEFIIKWNVFEIWSHSSDHRMPMPMWVSPINIWRENFFNIFVEQVTKRESIVTRKTTKRKKWKKETTNYKCKIDSLFLCVYSVCHSFIHLFHPSILYRLHFHECSFYESINNRFVIDFICYSLGDLRRRSCVFANVQMCES